jgi:hypothetical protein
MLSIVRLRAAGLGVLAGVLAGLVAGLVARIDMRVVALSAGLRPSFTLGGSLNILMFGAIIGAAFGLVFALIQPYLPGPRPGWLIKGLGFGLLLFLALELPLYLWQPDFRNELALAPGNLGIALFAPLPFIFGISLGLAAAPLDRRLPTEIKPRSAAWVVFGALLVLGLFGLGMVVYGIAQAIVEAGR